MRSGIQMVKDLREKYIYTAPLNIMLNFEETVR